jgi:hypothetical protein
MGRPNRILLTNHASVVLQVVGIEVLDVKKRFPNADPKTIRLEMA